MSDYIEHLPTDNDPLTPESTKLMNQIFPTTTPSMRIQAFASELQTPIVIGILFLLLSNSYTTNALREYIPYLKTSDISLLYVKALIMVILVFIYNNIQYAKK